MLGVLAVIAAVFLACSIGAWFAAASAFREIASTFSGIRGHLSTISEGPETVFSLRLVELEDAVERLPRKWEDIKREALASEARARAHIKRAFKELDERGLTDPGVDQLGRELQVQHGDGSEEGELSPVSEAVAVSPSGDAGPEGWAEVARNHKFGG